MEELTARVISKSPKRKRKLKMITLPNGKIALLPVLKNEKKRNWNDRFAYVAADNISKCHPFFREYFDKPKKEPLESITLKSSDKGLQT